MEFHLSTHAEKRVLSRGIKPEWIAAALDFPARIENDMLDPALVHVLLPVPEKGFRVLRVIYNETIAPVTIVTAYFDDTLRDI
ncbi:MAG: hypothetical protein C3F18_06205 [Nitrosomonadales bacterium]|nr:MAG: hypothetical protein C3F18_06205 [Nitrosomonadales bacterium]